MGRAEEWAAVRAESRRLLDEAEAERAFQADVSSDYQSRAWIDELLGPTDPLEKWRRGQLEAEAERAAFRQREADDSNARRTRDWERWTDARIARALFAPNGEFVQTIGAVIAEERHREREERKAALDELRSEFAAALGAALAKGDECVKQLRAEMARTKAVDDGSLVDITPSASVVRKVKTTA